MKLGDRTLKLQKTVRRLLARKKYVRFLSSVVKLQGKHRVKKAKAELRELRIQARDVGKLKQSNEDMKAEIDRLRAAVIEAQSNPVTPFKAISTSERDESASYSTPTKTRLEINDDYISPPTTSKERFQIQVDEFKKKMVIGIKGKVYTVAFPVVDCAVTISQPSLLCFSPPAPRSWIMSLMLGAFPDIPSISVCEITDIQSGLSREALSLFPNISEKERAANLFVSITYTPTMICAIGLSSTEDRNALINGLRGLISEVNISLDKSFLLSSAAEAPLSSEDGAVAQNKFERLASQVYLHLSQYFSLSTDVFCLCRWLPYPMTWQREKRSSCC
jgi:hypothetical protein